MDETKQNGVLIYMAVEDKTFVILLVTVCDVVQNDLTPKTLWSLILQNNVSARFDRRCFKSGERTKRHFPWSKMIE
jgi:hypothetical protein